MPSNHKNQFTKFESVIHNILTEIKCWKGYKKRGTKKRNGKTVNNCIEESIQFFDPDIYHKFFIALASYQSNHYGLYNSMELFKEYMKLPEDFKKFMTIPKSQYKNCFRGDDGKTEKPVSSFVYNKDPDVAKSNASNYGRYVFSLIGDGKSLISTMTTDFNKFKKFFGIKQWNRIVDDYGIGDDENEVLVFGLKYK